MNTDEWCRARTRATTSGNDELQAPEICSIFKTTFFLAVYAFLIDFSKQILKLKRRRDVIRYKIACIKKASILQLREAVRM